MKDHVVEAADIIIEEKGQSEYERRLQARKTAEEARKQREADMAADMNDIPSIVIKQQ